MKLLKTPFITFLCFSILLNFCSKAQVPNPNPDPNPNPNANPNPNPTLSLRQVVLEKLDHLKIVLHNPPFKDLSKFDSDRKILQTLQTRLKEIKITITYTEEDSDRDDLNISDNIALRIKKIEEEIEKIEKEIEKIEKPYTQKDLADIKTKNEKKIELENEKKDVEDLEHSWYETIRITASVKN